MRAAKIKYAISLQRSASAPDTMVTEEEANAIASRKRAIVSGSVSASRSKKYCTHVSGTHVGAAAAAMWPLKQRELAQSQHARGSHGRQ